MTMSEVK